MEKKEKGCLLGGVLILTLLGTLFFTFFSGAGVIVSITDHYFTPYMLFYYVAFALCIYSYYAIYATSKMRKKGAYGLLIVYFIGIILNLLMIFDKKPESPDAKTGFVTAVVFIICSIIFAVIIWRNINRME